MIIKTEDGRYVDLEKAIPFEVSKEERKLLNQKMKEKYSKKLQEEKEARSVPLNDYHIQTVKKIYKDLGYELDPIFGGYKGCRYQPRQRYNVVETFGEKRIILTGKDYFELGQILEHIGAM